MTEAFPCTGNGPCARGWTMLTPAEGQSKYTCPKCGSRYELGEDGWIWVGKASEQMRLFEKPAEKPR